MLDLALLRIMKYKKEFSQMYPGLPKNALDKITIQILADFDKYFERFPTHFKIDLDVFLPRFKQWHPTLTDEQHAMYKQMLSKIQTDVDDSTRAGIMIELFENSMAQNVMNTCARFEQGELDLPLLDYLTAEVDAFKLHAGARAAKWEDTDVFDLFNDAFDDAGVHWRLMCLNECMRGLRPGDFGIIAGRPDKGKTTFLASEITHMAGQLPEDKNILWFNNEGLATNISRRIVQAALGQTASQIKAHGADAQEMYVKAVGRRDKIRVFDIHGCHVGQVEAMIEQNNPGIIIYDMIDNIRGFGNEARTDLQLEKMYQWARERSVKYSCIGFATSQISSEGESQQYPTLSMLKDSKTGKQGACDFQLMIGASNEESLKYNRYVSLPKNKLRREGSPGDPHCEVLFKPDIARYIDVDFGE